MASVYPGALDTFPTINATDDMDAVGVEHDVVHTEVHNSLVAIQTELGVNPAGGFATVVARLNDIDAGGVAAYLRSNTDDTMVGRLRINRVATTGALSLDSGDTGGATNGYKQITLGYSGAENYRHAITTRHNAGAANNNAIAFWLWDYGVDAIGDIGTFKAFELNDGGSSIYTDLTATQDLTVTGTVTTNTGLVVKGDAVTGESNPSNLYIESTSGDAAQLGMYDPDSGARFWLHLNSSVMYLLGNNGTSGTSWVSPYPLTIHLVNKTFDVWSGDFIVDADTSITANQPTTFNSTASFNSTVNLNTGSILNHNTSASYDKIRVWNASTYAIGMNNALTYGGLGGESGSQYAMTFTMGAGVDRGFLWRDSAHGASEGAMSLDLEGHLHVREKVTLGQGGSTVWGVLAPWNQLMLGTGVPAWIFVKTLPVSTSSTSDVLSLEFRGGDWTSNTEIGGWQAEFKNRGGFGWSWSHDTPDMDIYPVAYDNGDGTVSVYIKCDESYSSGHVRAIYDNYQERLEGILLNGQDGGDWVTVEPTGTLVFDGHDRVNYPANRGSILGSLLTKSTVTADGLGTFKNNIVLTKSGGTSATSARLFFRDPSNSQDVEIVHNPFDSELPEAGYGLWVKSDPAGANNQNATLTVEGNIYANNTNRVLTTADEGAGNGLDADTLDGIQGASYLRSDSSDTFTANTLTMDNDAIVKGVLKADRIDNVTGTQLVINSGDSETVATGQTSEKVYINAEGGLEVNSSPDNWGSGWGNRDTIYLDNGRISATGLTKSILRKVALGDPSLPYQFKAAATFKANGTNQTGAIVVNTGRAMTNDMAVYRIYGYIYEANSQLDLRVSGYDYLAGPSFLNTGYINLGSQQPGQVRFGRDASGNVVVIVGDVADTWQYPQIMVDVLHGYTGTQSSFDNMTVSLVTDLTGYTDLVAVGEERLDAYVRNSDLLDGISSASFLRSDASDSYTGTELSFGASSKVSFGSTTRQMIDLWSNTYGIGIQSGTTYIRTGGRFSVHRGGSHNDNENNPGTGGVNIFTIDDQAGEFTYLGNTIWHAGNDGGGSGLDADTVDGLHEYAFPRRESITQDDISVRTQSGFYQSSTPTTAEGWPVNGGWYHLISATHNNVANYYSMQFAADFYNAANLYFRVTTDNGTATWYKVWHAGNDGSGSGLDADLLDGVQGASYLRSDVADSHSGGGGMTFVSGLTVGSGATLTHNADQSYDKLRVWTSGSYTIGMRSSLTFGHLNDYAMTFTMSNTVNRGFLWRDYDDALSDGAMSLTTDGRLHVKNKITIGTTGTGGEVLTRDEITAEVNAGGGPDFLLMGA